MPLKIRPGRYLTRSGLIADVCNRDPYGECGEYLWSGTIEGGVFRRWAETGEWFPGRCSGSDLIRRLPSKPKRKPANADHIAILRKALRGLLAVCPCRNGCDPGDMTCATNVAKKALRISSATARAKRGG